MRGKPDRTGGFVICCEGGESELRVVGGQSSRVWGQRQ